MSRFISIFGFQLISKSPQFLALNGDERQACFTADVTVAPFSLCGRPLRECNLYQYSRVLPFPALTVS